MKKVCLFSIALFFAVSAFGQKGSKDVQLAKIDSLLKELKKENIHLLVQNREVLVLTPPKTETKIIQQGEKETTSLGKEKLVQIPLTPGLPAAVMAIRDKRMINRVKITQNSENKKEYLHLSIKPDKKPLTITGYISDTATNAPLAGTFVFLVKNSNVIEEQIADTTGKYEFSLDAGAEYTVVIRKDMVRKPPASAEIKDTAVVSVPIEEPEKKTISENNIRFKVQLAASKSLLAPDHFIHKNIEEELEIEETDSGFKRYMVGSFPAFEEAEKLRRSIVRTGIPDAFVVAYKNGKRIDLKEAKSLAAKNIAPLVEKPVIKEPVEKDSEETQAASPEKAEEEVPETVELPPVVEKKDTFSLTYRIQLAAAKKPLAASSPVLQKVPEAQQEKGKDGYIRYYVGGLGSFDEAKQKQKELVSKGIKDSFIIPFKNGRRITIKEAMVLEEKQ